jgi:alpha-D-xyloside xylohydrolase
VRKTGSKKYSYLFCWSACVIFLFFPLNARAQAVVTREQDGVQIQSDADVLRLIVCGPNVIHVVAAPLGGKVTVTQPPWISQPCRSSEFSVKQVEQEAVLETSGLVIRIFLVNGRLSIADSKGAILVNEFEQNPRHYERGNGDNTYRVTDNFRPAEDEAFYGFGQHQSGIFNNRGTSATLAQKNTDFAIPFFLSTTGYGILWNSASVSAFDNRFPTELKLTAEWPLVASEKDSRELSIRRGCWYTLPAFRHYV